MVHGYAPFRFGTPQRFRSRFRAVVAVRDRHGEYPRRDTFSAHSQECGVLTAAACVRGAGSGMVFGKSRESAVLHRRRYGRMLPDAARLEVGEKEMK